MRTAYLEALYELSGKDKNILALISDNGAIVYDKYRSDFKDQFINFGISEANMIAASAGLASCGKIPFTYTIANFLVMRAFEFVRNDVCMQNMNVKLIGTGVGLAYSTLGPTHHATEDLAITRVLPNLTIITPASPMESRKATFAAANTYGPFYIRLGTNKEPEIYDEDYEFEVGKGVTVLEGNDITVIATGSILYDVVQVAKKLLEHNISVRVINIHTIKPIDDDIIINAAKETKGIITLEEHSIFGGLGTAVSEVLIQNGVLPKYFKSMGLYNCFAKGYGTYKEMREMNGISMEDLEKEILKALNG